MWWPISYFSSCFFGDIQTNDVPWKCRAVVYLRQISFFLLISDRWSNLFRTWQVVKNSWWGFIINNCGDCWPAGKWISEALIARWDSLQPKGFCKKSLFFFGAQCKILLLEMRNFINFVSLINIYVFLQ